MNLEQLLSNTAHLRTLQNKTYDNRYFNETFKPLLDIGKHFEQLAIGRIMKYNNYNSSVQVIKDNSNEFDINIHNIKYEIKTDIKAVQTSNLFVEFICNAKPSGIITTKANYYIFVIPYLIPMYVLIDVLELEFLISTQEFERIFQPNVYNNYTGGYIFKVETIIKNGILI
jgi:hypothetical protein